jgi:hypothetical protein
MKLERSKPKYSKKVPDDFGVFYKVVKVKNILENKLVREIPLNE